MSYLKSSNARCLIAGFSALLFFSCSTTSHITDPSTSATLWVQNSAEYQALTTSVYHTATSNLALALADSYWSAYPKADKASSRKLPPVIILDVDETVLDNSSFQAQLIKQHSHYTDKKWSAWVKKEKADAVTGALAFLRYASRKDIAIFYLTNRNASLEKATIDNLNKLGFPDADNNHLLCNNERPGWTSDKIKRRAFVAKDHRILMLFGDDLNDFVPAKNKSQQDRDKLVKKFQKKWGRQWFILPNPVYGSWESALVQP